MPVPVLPAGQHGQHLVSKIEGCCPQKVLCENNSLYRVVTMLPMLTNSFYLYKAYGLYAWAA